jgi:hypothetical protein
VSVEKKISYFYTAKPISYEKINDEFTKMRCYVLATGKNANFSNIGKDAVEKALPSLFNIPVVGHLKQKDDGSFYIGGHDRQLIIENDSIYMNDLTVPFGVVPETSITEYVNVTENDGSIAEYLVCDIILWTGRYGEIMDAAYSDDIYFGQSMEIIPEDVVPLNEDKNYQDIKSFQFSALCLLGKSDNADYHTEPCFPSACVKPITYQVDENKFTTEFSIMMSKIEALYSSFENITTEKGGELMDEKLKLLQEHGLTAEEINFEFEDLSIEEMKEKITEFINSRENTDEAIVESESQATEPAEDTAETFSEETNVISFSATYNQKREALNNALSPIIITDESGNTISETYFWVCDFDDEFVYVEKSEYTNGDSNYSNGRFTYTFDDVELVATLGETYEEMVLTWLTKEESQRIQSEKSSLEDRVSALESELNSYTENHSADNAEVEELRAFKNDRLASDRKDSVDAIFSAFDEKLNGTEEYDTLKENYGDLPIQEIEDKCYAMVGKKDFKFSAVTKKPIDVVKIPIASPKNEDEPYDGLFGKFGKHSKNKD